SLRTHDVLAMCRVYGVADDLTEALVSLATETKAKGWWQAYGDAVPEWFELYVGLEAAALRLLHYEPGLVPGLLQPRECARTIIATAPGITPAEVERKVALRMERQKLLKRRIPKAPVLDVILDEAVLRRPLPDAQAMQAQLQRLADASKTPNVRVRIVPRTTGPYRNAVNFALTSGRLTCTNVVCRVTPDRSKLTALGPYRALLAGAFVILSFPTEGARPAEPSIVYSESLTGALYLDKDKEISTYEADWKV